MTKDEWGWPTIGLTKETCPRCGEVFPPDTRILAVWSKTRFHISCQCSPREWIEMVIPAIIDHGARYD